MKGKVMLSEEQQVMSMVDQIVESIAKIAEATEQIQLLNKIRARLHEVSPLKNHPVDFVEWVVSDFVEANDYNPNQVAPPEMELLRLSIAHDGYTQPVVTFSSDNGMREVVDGFHRNRVARECPEVTESLYGFIPAVRIREDASDRSDRIASTIRHNRARGKHQVVKMTDIVLELKRRGWTDGKVSKHLGMDADEVLRLSQIGGLADVFADRDFSMAWEVDELDDHTVA